MLAGVQEYCVTFFTQYFFTILFRVIAVTVIGDVTQHVFALARAVVQILIVCVFSYERDAFDYGRYQLRNTHEDCVFVRSTMSVATWARFTHDGRVICVFHHECCNEGSFYV